MAVQGIYIYGIVPNRTTSKVTTRLLNESGIYTISYLHTSAIVSDSERKSVNQSDKESLGRLLVHHQRMIENLKWKGFNILIPVKLGTIVKSKEEVLKILANGHVLINEILKKIENLTEIDLAVVWATFPVLLNEIALDPDIIAMKDEMQKRSNAPLQNDQLKLGRLMQTKIIQKNKDIELKILDELSPFCIDTKTHEVMNDEMITNAAFLIDKHKTAEFEQVIDRLDEEFDGLLKFKLIGPLPCYSFYTIEVKELNPEQVVQAKKELELNEKTSELEIKRAYLEKARIFHPDTQVENGEESFNKINKAYHILIDYSAAVRQSSKTKRISLSKEKVTENLVLVKIKD